MNTKTVAITGGAGFIGAYLVRRFAGAGYHVVVIDNFMRGTPARLDGVENITLAQVDILDLNALTEATKGCQAIFHLAAINGTENFYKIPDVILEVGIKGMFNVLDACKANNIKELVVASSAEAYQDPEEIPTPESVILKVPDPLNPRYSYGASKLISEVLAMNFYREHFEKLQVFRPHNIYGPDMGTKHVIPQFIIRALEEIENQKGDQIQFDIQGDGSETRAFCYIDDLIEAFWVMYHHGAHRNIYHLGNPEEVSIKQVVDSVFSNVQTRYTLNHLPITSGSVSRRCPDISKVAALGYQPKVNLQEGVKRTFDWYFSNQHAPKSTNEFI
jgi:UDP-glucose 4-epimerase